MTAEPKGDSQRGSRALAESLQLQETARERLTVGQNQRGRRRKGDVIDLELRTLVRSRRRKLFFAFLTLEAVIAAIAIAVLIAYLASGDPG